MDHRLLSQYLVFCPGLLNLASSTEKRDYVVQEVGVVQHALLGSHIEHKLTKLLTTVVNILREDKKDRAKNSFILFFLALPVLANKQLWLNRSTMLKGEGLRRL